MNTKHLINKVLFGILNNKGNKTAFANWLIINVKSYIYVSKMQKKKEKKKKKRRKKET